MVGRHRKDVGTHASCDLRWRRGACTAYFLSRRGIEVIVVESTEVAAAASGKAGGFLADWCAGTPLDLSLIHI